ncbi:uncharacterized protein [Rutidosis leptorrhynchoides]|uniref:uncharacterized protein n=1 Tax=Rutidosis leptorrhynchoides TaxID=125765 RepID=UPI003A99C3B2
MDSHASVKCHTPFLHTSPLNKVAGVMDHLDIGGNILDVGDMLGYNLRYCTNFAGSDRDLHGLQESKMTRLQLFRLKSIWGNNQFDYAITLSRGSTGGIISLWDPNAFIKDRIWYDDNYVIVKGRWVRENMKVFMVNVYAPQPVSKKAALWNKISAFMSSNVPLGGLQYTWRNKAGSKFSKTDRYFVTNYIVSSVDDLKGVVMPRGSSDHSPVFLFQDNVDFGPTYFKVFDSWFNRHDFDATVRNAWSLVNVDVNLPLTAKFRLLKSSLKEWIKQTRLTESARLK